MLALTNQKTINTNTFMRKKYRRFTVVNKINQE